MAKLLAPVMYNMTHLFPFIQVKNFTGADLIYAAAKLGLNQDHPTVIVIKHSRFNTSSYGYSSTAVLVNTSNIEVPTKQRLVGKSSINIPGNPYAVLTHIEAQKYLIGV